MKRRTLKHEIIDTLRAHGEIKRIDLYRANTALLASFARAMQTSRDNHYTYCMSCGAEHALVKLVRAGVVVRTRYAHYKLAD